MIGVSALTGPLIFTRESTTFQFHGRFSRRKSRFLGRGTRNFRSPRGIGLC
ncbi:hypothetical protein CA85_30180 [Allorhodopirellula solitaria]|uniref:Uncharacterized protein n=1 Tax=Allorhodopirellula solitaria TaxID=2527987 RepID=A0A5C5XTF8_9BACT|nr:hypothetical protein CA85_30180 [Allorhodopirellula solitaria]